MQKMINLFMIMCSYRFLSSDIRFLSCFEQNYRSTNHLSVVTTLAYTTNLLPNVPPPTQHSYASNVPLRVVDVSSLPMVLPSWPNSNPKHLKSCTIVKSVFRYPTLTSPHHCQVWLRRVLRDWWMWQWHLSLIWIWK